jgi:hypothetical protein
MQTLWETVSIVAPVFVIVFLGMFLKRIHILDDHFIQVSSRLVFMVALPALVFHKISQTDITQVLSIRQIALAYVSLLLFFTVLWGVGHVISDPRERGAFMQGSFRSNYAILGFALIQNAFGDHALANAAVLLAFVMPLYNIMSVTALILPLQHSHKRPLRHTLYHIILNPLILAAVLALPVSYLSVPIPAMLNKSIGYIASVTLPIALLGIGGSLSGAGISRHFRWSALASFFKLIVMPVCFTTLAVYLGFRGESLAVLFFLFAAPSAVAGYPMARAMGSSGELAGNIILMSTLGAIITLSVGLYLLKTLSLV